MCIEFYYVVHNYAVLGEKEIKKTEFLHTETFILFNKLMRSINTKYSDLIKNKDICKNYKRSAYDYQQTPIETEGPS